MKRFAVILIIAVLALGCVFATAGDSQNTAAQNANSGDSLVVTTTIGKIYPVYQIVASNNQTTVTSAKSPSSAIEGILINDGDGIQINIDLQHFGKAGNNLDSDNASIRYYGSVEVTIEAGALINQMKGITKTTSPDTVTTENHVYMSATPTAGTFTPITATDNFSVTDTSSSSNKVTMKANYINGQKVETGTGVAVISSGSFTWDISKLTAGDTYNANIKVTYTNEN